MIKFFPTKFAGSDEIRIAYFNETIFLLQPLCGLRAASCGAKCNLTSLNYIQSCVGLCVKTASNKKRGSEGAQTS